jgi:phytoene dehydrogenase-like protein
MARSVDAVIIGSGHNSLVAAAYLAGAGWDVEVLERNQVPGGCVATEELTEPGYKHDTFSCWHPLFHISGAFAELGGELAARGLNYVDMPDATTASVRSDGATVVAYRDPQKTVEGFAPADRGAYMRELEEFGASIGTLGELLGTELYSFTAGRLAFKLRRQLGHRNSIGLMGGVVSSARAWYETRFEGREVSDLYAAWALHTGLSPEDAGSGFQSLAIAGTVHQIGLPVVQGGSIGFVNAFQKLIEDRGGKITTGTEVEKITVRDGSASGVIAGGEEISARQAVIANVTPTALYGKLLPEGAAPPDAVREGTRYRYGRRSGMQIHVALKEPLRWKDSRLDDVAIVHLCDGMEGVSLACAQAAAGLLPGSPTVVVGQPAAVDPSRAPEGGGIVWVQLQEVPYAPRGDAAGEIDTGDGTWSDEVTSAYSERVLAKIAPHVENWTEARGTHFVLPPPELERRNPNLVRGDIYSGDCELGQAYLWRPLPRYGSHATPVDRLFQIGASTFPGPGLNAASGRIVAQRLLKRGVLRRAG